MKKWMLLLVFCSLIWQVNAQQTISLEQCYQAARTNYPLLKQKDLQGQIAELTIQNIDKMRRLPLLTLNGQASWQNEVTKIPISLPNVTIEGLSKDQYRLTLDANYVLFDGNLGVLQTQLQRANSAIEQQKVEVELNKLKDQVNAFYLNALLMNENLGLIQTLLEDLKNRIAKLSAGVKFGTAIQTNVDVLEAEMLKTEQRMIELQAARKGFRAALALLTGLPIDENTIFQNPENQLTMPNSQRPEYQLFNLQKSYINSQAKLIENKKLPRLSAFVQTGVGRPSLNFLNNDFRGMFTSGLRLSWMISNFYTAKNESTLLNLNRQLVDSQEEVFSKMISIQLRQQQTEIDKWQGLIAKDQALVVLRTKIKNNASMQLENGIITASDYVNELAAENQAKINQKIHAFQLLMAQINYATLAGN